MKPTTLVRNWNFKYSRKPLTMLSDGTLYWYKWASKVGRKYYLKRSKIKTKRFERKHPGNLSFRVFKTLVLKNKNVNPRLMFKLKKLIETNGAKGAYKYKHLTPKALYDKMKGM